MPSCIPRAISLIISILIALFAVTLDEPVAAEAENNVASAPLPADEAPRVISILQSRDEISQYLKQAADKFSEGSKNTRFSVHTVANASDYRVALRAKILSGDTPDIFHIFGYQDMKSMLPQLEDLSGLDWVHDALPGLLEPVTNGESVYGVPYSVEGIGLIVNAEIFELAEVYIGNFNTLEELDDAFKQLQEKIGAEELLEAYPNLEAVTEFAAQDKAYIGTIMPLIMLTGEFGSPSGALSAKYINMPQSTWAKELVRLMALYSSCTKWEQLSSVTQLRQLEDGLASGRIAAVLQSTEAYRRIYAANPEMKGKLRLLPLPVKLEDSPGSAVYTGTPVYWAINALADENSKNGAKALLEWLYCSNEGAETVAGKFGAVSPYRSNAVDTGVELHSQLLKQIGYGNTLPQWQNEYPSEWINDTVVPGLRDYFALETDWDSFIRRCKEEWYAARLDLG